MLYWVPHCSIVFLKSPRPSLLIKRAALGNLKTSFHCTHWHRFFPLKRAPPLISVFFNGLYTPFGSPVSGGTEGKKRETALQCYICPTCPSPAGGSLTHSQALALSKRARDVTALRCSEPLRSKVGGASKPSPYFAGWDRLITTCFWSSPWLCGMGPPGESLLR